jgi:hypothetical protein
VFGIQLSAEVVALVVSTTYGARHVVAFLSPLVLVPTYPTWTTWIGIRTLAGRRDVLVG